MDDARTHPGRPRFALSRGRDAAIPPRRARRVPSAGFDALERRGLMSVASAPATLTLTSIPAWYDLPAGGHPVVSVIGPIAPADPGALASSIRPVAMLPGVLDRAAFPDTLSSRLGELPDAPILRSLEIASPTALGSSVLSAPIPIPIPIPIPPGDPARPTPAPGQPSTVQTVARVAMAGAQYAQDGVVVREFAFANHAEDQVSVRNGDQPSVMVGTRDDGVRGPSDVKLVDLDGDSIQDLVVANSGADNLLIFPGLPGGRFAAETTGGRGIPVGAAPAGITVGDVDGDGIPDMVVANRGSNDLSLLLGQGQVARWSFADGGRLRAGIGPVACLLEDVDHDGFVDILICNSGSNTVSVLRGLGGGRFDDEAPTTLAVGDGPVQIFLGRFDHRPEPELLTVNSRSNDLTLISDFMGDHPTTETIASGGLTPTSAFASDFDSDGLTDLIVANTGDGKLALFQGSDAGLSLTSLVTSSAIPAPTAVLGGDQSPDGFDIYAVSAGQDAASILHFDLARDSEEGGFVPTLPTITKGSKADEDDLSAQLVSHGDSAFNLVGVLGFASSRGESSEERDEEDRDTDAGRIARSRTGAQSLDDDENLIDIKPESDAVTPGPGPSGEDDPTAWTRFVLGLDEALDEAREVAGHAIGSRTSFGEEGGPGQDLDTLALHGPAAHGPSEEAKTDPNSAVDEAIRSIWSGAAAEPGDVEPPGAEPVDEGTGRVESIPTVSLGLIFAHQLLIRVAPPRRPRSRRPPARRPGVDAASRLATRGRGMG